LLPELLLGDRPDPLDQREHCCFPHRSFSLALSNQPTIFVRLIHEDDKPTMVNHSMTNETTEIAARPSRHRRPLRSLLISVGIILFIWGGLALNDRIRPVMRFSEFKTAFPADVAERYFNAVFPTERDIEAYLSNKTILLSDGAFQQAVYYVDDSHHFLKWTSDSTSLRTDEWFTKWYFLPMELNGRWRVALVYSFCTWFPTIDIELPPDSCRIIQDLRLLFAGANAHREYRSGNIFGLSAGGTAPFRLPSGTRISIDGLLAMEKNHRAQ
jgi:hypothetical protein